MWFKSAPVCPYICFIGYWHRHMRRGQGIVPPQKMYNPKNWAESVEKSGQHSSEKAQGFGQKLCSPVPTSKFKWSLPLWLPGSFIETAFPPLYINHSYI